MLAFPHLSLNELYKDEDPQTHTQERTWMAWRWWLLTQSEFWAMWIHHLFKIAGHHSRPRESESSTKCLSKFFKLSSLKPNGI